MFKRFIPPEILWFVITLWAVFLIDTLLIGINFNYFGIRPRNIEGLMGILLSPFLHASLYHLLSNSMAILILGSLLKTAIGPSKLRLVMIFGAIGSGVGVWLLASNALVVGASGMVFAFLGYLFADALFNPSLRSWLFAILSFFAYGSALFSLVSFLPHISWSAHFWGFTTGILLSYFIGRKRP
ncbi:rhomboid family intramembrane serine protease [Marinomonas algicola]|uniref:rhomboid family intramembrane serine protease n=1 Tax=Marinomonas algicola TaxID=2773454 RepID=UPI00174E554D|nr:rhomboid family intramembrane serine protease [Marinomonas algicola]